MDPTIKPVVKGETPSLIDTDKANEVIVALNALRKLKISPQGFGKLTLGAQDATLDLNGLKSLIDQLTTIVSAYSQQTGGGGGGGGGSSSSVTSTINQIIAGLAGMTLTLACDATTREITGTINLVLPPPL